jgi:hypothetical protein
MSVSNKNEISGTNCWQIKHPISEEQRLAAPIQKTKNLHSNDLFQGTILAVTQTRDYQVHKHLGSCKNSNYLDAGYPDQRGPSRILQT